MTLKIFIKLTPNAKKDGFSGSINIDNKQYFKLGIKAPPIDGKANEALIKYLAQFLNTQRNNIEITSGLTSKYKTVTIINENDEIINQLKQLLPK